MAQLGVQYPAGLEDLYGYGGTVMGQRYDIARRNEGINQDQALQDMYFAQQNQPGKVRHQELQNQTLEGQLPGVQAEAWGKDRDMQVRKSIPITTEQKAAAAKIAAQMTDDEWKQTVRGIYDMRVNGKTPEERANAQRMYESLPEIQKEILKQKAETERQVAVEKERGASTLANTRAQIAGGRWSHTSKVALTLDQAIDNAKTARERHQKLIDAATVARANGDEDKAQSYEMRAERIRPQAEAEINSPKPGSVHIPSVAPNVQVSPGPQIAPPGAKPVAKLSAAAAEDWIKRNMEHNKMTREEVIIEGKRLGKL